MFQCFVVVEHLLLSVFQTRNLTGYQSQNQAVTHEAAMSERQNKNNPKHYNIIAVFDYSGLGMTLKY